MERLGLIIIFAFRSLRGRLLGIICLGSRSLSDSLLLFSGIFYDYNYLYSF